VENRRTWGATLLSLKSSRTKVGASPISQPASVRYSHEVNIPEEIRASVLRRIRSLNRVERAAIMRASIIGRRFEVGVLASIVSCSDATLLAALDRASDLQLIASEGTGESYIFRHALTRDIIYAELLAARVRPLHHRVGRALEKCGSPDGRSLESLGYHFWAAGDGKRCLRYNELAGDNAAAIHACDDARVYYARARSAAEVDSVAYARLTQKLAISSGAHNAH
jgi:predicted ATPase